jgi:hypothetical protein
MSYQQIGRPSLAIVGSGVGSKLKKHFHFHESAFIFNNLVVMA